MVTVPQGAPAWAQQLADDVTRELAGRRRTAPVPMPPFPLGDLPDAARYPYCWIFVIGATGGDTAAQSDGTAWRRPDRTLID